MFTLNPNGGSGSSSSGASGASGSGGWGAWKPQCYFFGKLVTYFITIRLVHVFWGDKSNSPKAIQN